MIFVVTGGAGFIGSNLVYKLLEEGHEVRVIDNISTGHKSNLPNNSNLSFYIGDIINYNLLEKVIHGADYVINLAGFASVSLSMKFPLETHNINVTGFLNVLELSRKHHIKRVIYASSIAVYGSDEKVKQVEEEINLPLSIYALTKQVNEQYGNLYKRCYNLDVVGLRFSNVYGDKQNGDNIYCGKVAYYSNMAKQNQNIIIKGDGTATRNFVLVDDVVNIIAKLCFVDKTEDIYNISADTSIKLSDLAELIINNYRSTSQIVYLPEDKADIKHSDADNSKIIKLLKYKFKSVENYFGDKRC